MLSVGLVDSKDLLDIILEVEARCGVVFNPERITSRLASHWGAWLVRLTLRAGEASDAARRRGHFETEASMHCLTLPILG